MFLLDENLSPRMAGLCSPGLAVPLRDWCGGSMLGETDRRILQGARIAGLVLVTFDLATIPSLLQDMASSGDGHGGVVLISSRSCAQNDLRGIAKALNSLHQSLGSEACKNRIVFLRKPQT